MTEPAPAPPVTLAPAPQGHRLEFAFLLALLAFLFAIPFLFGLDPAYRLPQFNRFLALALFALSVDLIWGYTGLLSLGQGLYYGIGGYCVAYSLKLQAAALEGGLPRYDYGPEMALPDYMFQGQLNRVPTWIAPLININYAIALAVIVPPLVAMSFGYIVFRRRIKGVYFSLITQALVYAMFTLVSNQRTYTGGVDGQPRLAHFEILGFEFRNSYHLNLAITITIALFAIASMILMKSKVGKILTAIRDNEYRVMALGYDTAMYKTFVFTFAGLMAGIAGALSVCSTRSAGPQFFNIEESILVVIFVAVGGRGTILGPIIGALLVTVGQDQISGLGSANVLAWFGGSFVVNFTRGWPIILGCLFIGTVLFLPDGIIGGVKKFPGFFRRLLTRTQNLTAARRDASPATTT